MSTLIQALKIGFLGLLTTAIGAQAAVPTTGAYVTDPQSQYVADQATDGISTASQILCFLSNTRADAMVNLGNYIAFIDESKCDTSGRSDPSKSTSTSAAGTTSYSKMSLTSTRASNTDPQIIKGHAAVSGGQGGNQQIYINVSATAEPSASAPNGVLTMNYAEMSGTPSTRHMRGVITATATTLTFAESFSQGGRSGSTLMALTGDSTTGSGVVSVPNQAGGASKVFTFGYNGTNFCRSDGTTEKCFDRLATSANTPVWRYGVYTAAGARYDLASPGFSIKDASGNYGFASYWGVWLPTPPATGDTLTNAATAGTTYTALKTTGVLVKYTKVQKTLNEIAKIPFNFMTQAGASGLAINGLTANTSYEAYWDDVVTNFVITGTQSCGNTGCFITQVSPTISLTPTQMNTATSPTGMPSNGIQGWSQALGGNLTIPTTTLTNGTPATLTNGVAYFTQANVLPGDATVPTTLKCVRNCATAATLASNGQPYAPFTTGTNNWGNTLTADVVTYTWDPATYTLSEPGGAIASTSIVANLVGTQYNWGIQSGALVAAADLAGLECWTASGTYCDFKASSLSSYYVFTTGTQQSNTSTFLKKADNTYVTFDPPQSASFTVPTNTSGSTPYGTFAGSVMNLQFMGFGQLQGIPGKCFNPVDNTETSCGPNTKYVPAFAIPSDINGKVTIAGTDYFVKWLEREINFKVVSGTSASLGITLGNIASLPAAPVLTGDANDPSVAANTSIYPGDFAAVNFKKAPSVIHGVVQ